MEEYDEFFDEYFKTDSPSEQKLIIEKIAKIASKKVIEDLLKTEHKQVSGWLDMVKSLSNEQSSGVIE